MLFIFRRSQLQFARAATAALLVSLVVLTGCANDPEPSAGPPTQKQVDDALLSKDDVPEGFMQSAVGSTSGFTATPTGCAELDAITSAATAPEATAKGEVQFKKTEFGPFIQQSITVQPGKAAETFQRASQALQKCPTFTSEIPGGPATQVQLSPLALPRLGDESFGATVALQSGIAPVNIDLALVRNGETLVTCAYFALGGGDPKVLEDVTKKAVDKVTA